MRILPREVVRKKSIVLDFFGLARQNSQRVRAMTASSLAREIGPQCVHAWLTSAFVTLIIIEVKLEKKELKAGRVISRLNIWI